MAIKAFGLEIKGIDEIALRWAIAHKELYKGLEQGMFRAGARIQRRAQEILTINRHVVTGNLRRSIHTEVVVEQNVLEVIVGTNVEYAPYVEALPDGGYLFPAFMQEKEKCIKDLQDVVMDTINNVKGKGR